MKNIKKVIAVVLTVTFIFGTIALAASAVNVTSGPEDNNGPVNIKYEVVQLPELRTSASDVYTAQNNDIYAVTLYAKCKYGINFLRVPIFYNADHFKVISLLDGSDLYFKEDDPDGFTDISTYTLGKAWTDDKMVKANGDEVTKKALAQYVGLANENAEQVNLYFKAYDSNDDAALWAEHGAGCPAGYSEVFIMINDQGKVKNGYINTYRNAIINDYVDIVTFYFQRVDGVSEADCYNDIFGFTGSTTTDADVVVDGTQYASLRSTTGFVSTTNTINFCVDAVEAAIKPLVASTAANGAKSQAIAFKLDPAATPTYTEDDIASVDYRFVAQFSTTAIPIDYNTDGTVNSTDIDEVGFVMANAAQVADPSVLASYDTSAEILALTKDSNDANNCRKCWTAKISTDMAGDAAFAFSCRISGIAVNSGTVAAEYVAMPYVLLNDGTVYTGQIMTSSVQDKYTANVGTFLAKKNASA